MKPFAQLSASDRTRLRRSRLTLILLDFDGTLAPIVRVPEQAALPTEARAILKKIAAHPRLQLGIVSGRPLPFLRKKIGLKNTIYSGNHGLEALSPSGKRFVHPSAVFARPLIKNLVQRLRRATRGIPGIYIEDKHWSISFHLRRVKIADRARATRIFSEVTAPFVKNRQARIFAAKQVWEARPATIVDKGWMARKLWRETGATVPVFFGDDPTDEGAFKALRRGVTVLVGKRDSAARYFISSPAQTPAALSRLLALATGRASSAQSRRSSRTKSKTRRRRS